MKRIGRHLAFWFFYLALCMNMEYMWVSKVLPGMNIWVLWKNIIISTTVTTLPEVLFAYYIMYIGYNRITNKRVPVLLSLAEIFILLVVCILAIRLISFYLLEYELYDRRLAGGVLWDIPVTWRSFIYLGFSSGLALSLKLFRQQAATAKREKVLVEEKLNIELRLLRNQLNPHFLFNTLNNIYALARKKSDQAPETVMKLSELLDFMLYRSNTDTISLAEEIAFLEDYISLEKIRYNERLHLSFQKNISDADLPITPFLLLPLVENAFKHGASESRSDTNIDIALKEQNGIIEFSIENDVETVQNAKDTKEKLGLQNVKRRLELLYKEYSFSAKEEGNRFKVLITININSYGKN